MAKQTVKRLLHPAQMEVFKDKTRYKVLCAGRRFGKTHLAINWLLEGSLKAGKGMSWYVAPTYKQAKLIAWELIKQIIPSEIITQVNESELSVKLTNGHLICLKGADNPDSLVGVGLYRVVIDEYALMKRDIWHKIIRPTLVDQKGDAMFISTPRGFNHFYELYQKGLIAEHGFKSWHFTSYDNPFIDKKEIDEAKLSTTEAEFDEEYMASFVTEERKVVITSKILDTIRDHDVNYLGLKEIISCDPSLGGDECAIYVLRNFAIADSHFMQERDPMKLVAELMLLGKRMDINDFAIDTADNAGKVIAARMRELGANIHWRDSARKANLEDSYMNHRAEMWFEVAKAMRDGKVSDPTETELKRQLNAVRFARHSNGKLKLVPKDETKKLINRSPDRADSYIYGMYTMLYELEDKEPSDRWKSHRVDYEGEQEYDWRVA